MVSFRSIYSHTLHINAETSPNTPAHRTSCYVIFPCFSEAKQLNTSPMPPSLPLYDWFILIKSINLINDWVSSLNLNPFLTLGLSIEPRTLSRSLDCVGQPLTVYDVKACQPTTNAWSGCFFLA